MKFQIDRVPDWCDECGYDANSVRILEIGASTRVKLCTRCVRELVKILPHQRSPRGINRKQFLALEAIETNPAKVSSANYILERMGRYATNSFASLVARGLIAQKQFASSSAFYELTPVGLALYEALKFESDHP